VRASVVNAGVLAELATESSSARSCCWEGRGLSGGREKPSILADAMEAVLAATYLDGGWDAAYKLVMALLGERSPPPPRGPAGRTTRPASRSWPPALRSDAPLTRCGTRA